MRYDVIIIGAGPGGLSCATALASSGKSTLVVERSAIIGRKVCAGGITYNGLIGEVPETLIEKAFPEQVICSGRQRIRLQEPQPIIATVDREKLGSHMATQALEKGAEIRLSTSLHSISANEKKLVLHDHTSDAFVTAEYGHLVGADGANSKVRRFLGIPAEQVGIGINYQVQDSSPDMEWHLDSRLFANGYAWIFPHKSTVSIGAYIPGNCLSPRILKRNLLSWSASKGFSLAAASCRAGFINYDFRGIQFGDIFLVGDAAGLASALTGEGIYPAILSGHAVAEIIVNSEHTSSVITTMTNRQSKFRKMVQFTESHPKFTPLLAELGVFCLRTGLIDFSALEMASQKKGSSPRRQA